MMFGSMWYYISSIILCHHDQVIKERPPRIKTDTEWINLRLPEGISVEQREELQYREARIKLNPLEVTWDKPVEQITTFWYESKKRQ